MFGKGSERGEATIVEITVGDAGETQFLADIECSEPFRAVVQPPKWTADFHPPGVGEVVSVLVDGKTREVRFDTRDPRLSLQQFNAFQKDAAAEPEG